MQEEVQRLGSQLAEVERNKDREMADQRTEWAEVYAAAKRQE